MKASEAKEQSERLFKAQANSLLGLSEQVDREVYACVSRSLRVAQIALPQETDRKQLERLKGFYERLGYRVRLEQKTGVLGHHYIKFPGRLITLFW